MPEKFTAGIICAMVSVAVILAALVFDPSAGVAFSPTTFAITAGSFGLAAGFTLILAGIIGYV
ncbi:MAG TPA: hypothetical protein P5217_05965 [Methanoregulaceae archaeon]|nr:hypothetical protein [Methanoregulaceae archaeon]HPD75579.1 hypothetical protein [Methanoregulaceae archaeon]HRY75808.1 hypothetical protein [Methanoregulaceae archaeon]